ncbi:chitinase endochitinase 1 precursor [Scheffersomyces xylosifermentans]|uniref:chitinase endochitinase 1 precursor n=1 Tax=Scheffersomyces xylosifermentans TaxID=1304137 RepID=UPI00315CFD25
MLDSFKDKLAFFNQNDRSSQLQNHFTSKSSSTTKGTKNPNGYKTCIYFTNWSVYQRKHFATDIPIDHITHIFYAFITIDPDSGSVKFTDEWCDIQLPLPSPKDPTKEVTGSIQQLFELKQINRRLKVVMSIGGYGTEHLFQAVTSDANKLNNFVNSAIGFVKEYGFDGIDIDWEYPKNSQECAYLVQILSKLRSQLDTISPDLVLTIASPAGEENVAALNLREIDKYLSFWNVMCYDFCGESWSTRTGYHSNLFGSNGDNNLSASNVIEKYISSGVHSDKLVLGMPMYGRVFHGAQSQAIGEHFSKERLGTAVESDTIDYKKLPIGEEHFDSKAGSAMCYDSSSKQLIVYDDANSARMKAIFTHSSKLGGGMWWDSCGDNYDDKKRSLLQSYVNQLGGVDVLDKTPNHLDIYKESTFLKELQ